MWTFVACELELPYQGNGPDSNEPPKARRESILSFKKSLVIAAAGQQFPTYESDMPGWSVSSLVWPLRRWVRQ